MHRSAYLDSFCTAASSAAAPAADEVFDKYESAVVSLIVTSHKTDRPSRHGINDIPSGRFPSDLDKPDCLLFIYSQCDRWRGGVVVSGAA